MLAFLNELAFCHALVNQGTLGARGLLPGSLPGALSIDNTD